MLVCGYRNLTLARKDPSTYHYSIATVKGTKSRGTVIGHSNKSDGLQIGGRDFYLVGPMTVTQESTLIKIGNGSERSVCAWIVGDFFMEYPHGTRERRFSINPKLGQTQFHWSDDGTVADITDAVAVRFSPRGTFAIYA